MGAWEVGPFDNDDAVDFVLALADLDDDERETAIVAALRLADDYVELPEANIAVAAAALIAAQRGFIVDDDPAVIDFLQDYPFTPDMELRLLAVSALERVLAEDSEAMELWEDAGLGSDYASVCNSIKVFL